MKKPSLFTGAGRIAIYTGVRKFALYASLILVAGAIALYIGARLATPENTEFWSTTLQNLGGELIGAALTIAGGFWLAMRMTRAKVTPLSPAVTAVLTDLRTKGQISPEAARASVVAAVSVMNHDKVNADVSPRTIFRAESCRVCGLRTEKDPKKERCAHCKLPRPMWATGSPSAADATGTKSP